MALAGAAACFAPVFAGCSEAPPLIPRGGWTVVFEDIPGCGPGAENQAVGIVDADARNELKEDGVDDVKVSCTVLDNGGSFEILAIEATKGLTLTLSIQELKPGSTKDNPSIGSVSYASPNTAGPFTSAACNFYFLEGTGQGVKAGEVWLTFDCPEISIAIDNTCRIPIGYAAFENCKSTEDE